MACTDMGTDDRISISGHWTGRYEYGLGAEPVPFEAVIAEAAGQLLGDITEPNTFHRDMGAELTATLMGQRTGHDVYFRKTYDGFDQGDDPVYEGQLNSAMTRILGRWRFPKSPALSGRFMMVRAVDISSRKETAVEAEALH
ncbi:hypothetical protein [Cognatiyoonia sp. IB215182]|uniref:hypothetical protein n=1 Tax=Cognatiyoonia sp. IB215182 TaxID=3097353 RepID=UPI002A0BC0EF|nr:hypothetical protein [Cognatiyoonia sp. IB215182]MDX8351914.1 hypothetical protein [Cognatiyoonia sp. IB215182]